MAVYDLNTAHTDLVTGFLEDACQELAGQCERIIHCLNQLEEADLWWRPHPEMNAVGNLVLHLSGNLRQWVLAGVGGQPDTRQRQQEFDQRDPLPGAQRGGMIKRVGTEACSTPRTQAAAALLDQRPVQHYQTTGLTAILHAVCHFVGHAQEIVYITRWRRGADYEFQWRPPGQR